MSTILSGVVQIVEPRGLFAKGNRWVSAAGWVGLGCLGVWSLRFTAAGFWLGCLGAGEATT